MVRTKPSAAHLCSGLVLTTPAGLAGMIIPYVVSYSLMFGAILSQGIMWPLIAKQEGNWYPAGESAQSFAGLFGYKVKSLASLLQAFLAGGSTFAAICCLAARHIKQHPV